MNHWVSKAIAAISISILLSACIEERITVKVKKDGSGVVEYVAYGGDYADTQTDSDDYFQKVARGLGDGVVVKRYSSAKNDIGMQGFHATYAFEDINHLKLASSEVASGTNPDKPDDAERLLTMPDFSMKNGELSVNRSFKHDPNAPKKKNDHEDMSNSDRQMMARMMKGLRYAINIEGLDPIKESNARHSVDNGITLIDLNFDLMIKNKGSLAAMFEVDTVSVPLTEAQTIADSIDGLDIDMQEKITIRF